MPAAQQTAQSVDLLSLRGVIEATASRYAPAGVALDREDLAQDAFLACLEALPRFTGQEQLKTFLFLRIRGSMIDSLRRWDSKRSGRTRIAWVPLDDLAEVHERSPEPLPDDQAAASERAERLHAGLARLSEGDRFILDRIYFYGWTLERLSKELGCKESRACQRRKIALDHLEAQLTPDRENSGLDVMDHKAGTC